MALDWVRTHNKKYNGALATRLNQTACGCPLSGDNTQGTMSAKSGDATLQLALHVTKIGAPTGPRHIPGSRKLRVAVRYIKSAKGIRLQKASNYGHAQKSGMHKILTDKPCARHHNSLLLECAGYRQERGAGGHTKDVASEEGCLFPFIRTETAHQR